MFTKTYYTQHSTLQCDIKEHSTYILFFFIIGNIPKYLLCRQYSILNSWRKSSAFQEHNRVIYITIKCQTAATFIVIVCKLCNSYSRCLPSHHHFCKSFSLFFFEIVMTLAWDLGLLGVHYCFSWQRSKLVQKRNGLVDYTTLPGHKKNLYWWLYKSKFSEKKKYSWFKLYYAAL